MFGSLCRGALVRHLCLRGRTIYQMCSLLISTFVQWSYRGEHRASRSSQATENFKVCFSGDDCEANEGDVLHLSGLHVNALECRCVRCQCHTLLSSINLGSDVLNIQKRLKALPQNFQIIHFSCSEKKKAGIIRLCISTRSWGKSLKSVNHLVCTYLGAGYFLLERGLFWFLWLCFLSSQQYLAFPTCR